MKSINEDDTSDNHKDLSAFIKKVHKELRENCKLVGADKAWEIHCANENNLKRYAITMEKLATNHWEKNSKDVTRIIWTCNTIQKYFNKDIIDIRIREFNIAKKIGLEVEPLLDNVKKRPRLLDVGSCYNPFLKFDYFEVIAIDIAPAVSEVIECDFLKLEVGGISETRNKKLVRLPRDYFDVIVFSLFLEYLPSPTQRKLCCEKAYKLLSTEGLLVIITPDSNHVGSNSKIIKSWQFILAEIGFSRIKYEKLSHLHCMAFRKTFSNKITMRWAELHKKKQSYDQIYIPQDFSRESKLKLEEKIIRNDYLTINERVKFNEELPFCILSNSV